MTKKEIRRQTARIKRAYTKLEKFSGVAGYSANDKLWPFYGSTCFWIGNKYYAVDFLYFLSDRHPEIKIGDTCEGSEEDIRRILKPWKDLIV